mmetsp:Transcript_21321/g.62077  ORF Transcript_21321/g.62077 Transcript_21321/m.62077 type:complete len:106 (-) Transcript_21321:1334-1651(-)
MVEEVVDVEVLKLPHSVKQHLLLVVECHRYLLIRHPLHAWCAEIIESFLMRVKLSLPFRTQASLRPASLLMSLPVRDSTNSSAVFFHIEPFSVNANLSATSSYSL